MPGAGRRLRTHPHRKTAVNIYDLAPIRFLLSGAHWAITHLTDLLTPLAGASSAALAIIALTAMVRAVLIPVGLSQAKANATRQRLAPRIAELNTRHKSQPEILQRKMMEMYAKEGTSPLAGCLPVLAQMPILMAVYGLFIRPTINGHPNELLGYTLIGVPLDAGFLGQLTAGTLTAGSAALLAGIIAVIAVVAQITRRRLTPPASGAPTPPVPSPGAPNLTGMTTVLSYLPFLTAGIAAVVPLAAALYLMTTTTWTLVERLVLNRRYL